MDELIARHLRRWAVTEFVWGQTDCCLVLADYVLDVTGRDGAAHLRGRYATRGGCNRVTGFLRRGLVPVVRECAAMAGLAPRAVAQRGDIGVLRFANGVFVGGVCLGDGRWAIKSPDGLLTPVKPHVAAAWAVEG